MQVAYNVWPNWRATYETTAALITLDGETVAHNASQFTVVSYETASMLQITDPSGQGLAFPLPPIASSKLT